MTITRGQEASNILENTGDDAEAFTDAVAAAEHLLDQLTTQIHQRAEAIP